jgi:hypothetical protein
MKQATFNKNTAVQRVQHIGKRIYNMIGILIIVSMLGHLYYSIYRIASFSLLKLYIGTLCIVVLGLLVAGWSEWVYNKQNAVDWREDRSQFRKYMSRKIIRDITISVLPISFVCFIAFIL